MGLNLAKVTQQGAHPHAERGLDLYETPACAVRSLMRRWPSDLARPGVVWDPAVGRGAIGKALKTVAPSIVFQGSDIADYGCGFPHTADFLTITTPTYAPGEQIITNPPYRLAAEFVEKAVTLGYPAHFLMRLNFLEGIGRMTCWPRWDLRRVLVFSRRLPMMHRDGWEGKKATSAMPFAWFSFYATAVKRAPTIEWVDWAQYEE